MIGRIPYSREFQQTLAKRVILSFATDKSRPKKLLLLDLDNTLWGGTLDECGTRPIDLGFEGIGLAYREFQQAIKDISQRGILLGIVSKNDESQVREILKSHPAMALREEDFCLIKASWNPKSRSIREIVDTLDLAPDSFIMLDDNPREREEISLDFPEIILPTLPEDPSMLATWFINELVPDYFEVRTLTETDQTRTRNYQNRGKRKALESATGNFPLFLKNLNITLLVESLSFDDLPRAHQLIERTNQFNLNKHRSHLSAQQIEEPIGLFWKASYDDRFGKEGNIALLIAHATKEKLHIHSFALSCRVLEKGVEYALLLLALEQTRADSLIFEFESDGRNGRMQAFLDGLDPAATQNELIAVTDALKARLADNSAHIEIRRHG
jgi:FkbH-like protein